MLARWIEKLHPLWMLGLLALPAAAVLPLKFLAVWLMSNGAWCRLVRILFAKTAALGTTAFVFDAGREKLLQLQWFRKFHDYVIWLRQRAHELVDPIIHRLKYRFRLRPAARTAGVSVAATRSATDALAAAATGEGRLTKSYYIR